MFAALVALAILAPSALATVSMTAPVGSTTWQAGQPQTISWQDNGQAPSLQAFGPSLVSIYVGNAIQQTQLQLIVPNVDVSTTSSIQFTPDPSIGPDGNAYFIRFESLGCKDTSTPQNYPCEAFSAKFTMSGMTGTFNATIQAQIDGASTAPIGGATSTPAPAGSSATPSVTASSSGASKPASSGSASHSASASAKPSGSAQGNGAGSLFASAGLVASIAAVAGAMLL